MDIGKIIKSLRKKHDLTLVQLETSSKVSKAFLSAVERGEKTPTIDTLEKIAEGFGISLVELLRDEDLFKDNLKLVMRGKTKEQFVNEVRKSLNNPAFNIKLLDALLEGSIQPSPETIKFLSEYARVNVDFWYRNNNVESLEKEVLLYSPIKNNQQSNNSYKLPESYEQDIIKFILDENNIEYLRLAKRIADKNINHAVIETILFTDNKKRP